MSGTHLRLLRLRSVLRERARGAIVEARADGHDQVRLLGGRMDVSVNRGVWYEWRDVNGWANQAHDQVCLLGGRGWPKVSEGVNG